MLGEPITSPSEGDMIEPHVAPTRYAGGGLWTLA
jgi:hypothetical protein